MMTWNKLTVGFRWMKEASRWPEYATTKVPLVWPPIIALMVNQSTNSWFTNIRFLIFSTLFTALYLVFGYMLNDWSDAVPDKLAGKPNRIGALQPKIGIIILGIVAILSAIVLFPLLKRGTITVTVVAIGFSYLAAMAYSLPPARLKVRGALGLLVGGAAQRVCPLLVIFATQGKWGREQLVFLALGMCIGLRWMLVHQILDEKNDRFSNTQTFVIIKGSTIARNLLRWFVFPLEVALIILAIFLPNPVWLAWVLLSGLVAEVSLRFILHFQRKFLFSLDTFKEIPLGIFYFLFWPVFIWLAFCKQPVLIFFGVGLVLLWQAPYISHEGRRFFRLISLVI